MTTNGKKLAIIDTRFVDNWFPHTSPDIENVVYLSYTEDKNGGNSIGRDIKKSDATLNE